MLLVVQKNSAWVRFHKRKEREMNRYDLQHTESAPPNYKKWQIPNTPQRKAFMTLIQNQIKTKTRTRPRDKEKEWEERQRWKEHRATPDIREVTAMTDRP